MSQVNHDQLNAQPLQLLISIFTIFALASLHFSLPAFSMTDSALSHFLFTPSLVKSTNEGPHSNDFETACLVDTSGL